MTTYYILEENLERLQKQLKTIENKCKKYNAHFAFNILDEEPQYREVTDSFSGETHIYKFIPVEAEGTISHGAWDFVAVLEHSEEGNIIRSYNLELEVPERYRYSKCTCEHCNTVRSRKDTYIVHNQETGEFKQVGKSCLMEYTRGLSAEDVTRYISWFDTIIKGEAPFGRTNYTRYFDAEEMVQYAIECVKNWGYQKRLDAYEDYIPKDYKTTRERVIDYYYYNTGMRSCIQATYQKQIAEDMASVNFKHDREENIALAKEMIAWASAFDSTESSDYKHNLKVVCRKPYVDRRDLGILLSVVPAYYKYLNQIEEDKKKAEAAEKTAAVSNWLGQEGERITVELESCEHVYTSESIYGYTYLYRMVDTSGNVLNWWSSSWVSLEDVKVTSVTGTVKKHEEYRGIKQTVLTRCKLATEKVA